MDDTRRYSGYDEYQGIFSALGSARTAGRGSTRSLAAKYGRATARYEDGLSGRRFPSSRRASTRRPSSGFSTNGYERRERYLNDRVSQRRVKPTDGEDLDDPDDETQRPPQQQIWLPTKNFTFRQRAGRLDTRALARLDLQKIVATTDVETIQRHLENLAFSDVTLEDVQQYSDAYFLKLFQIAQLTLEYLLNVQDSLASHCENLETQCEGLTDECQSLEAENNKVESEISALKKEIRQKQSTLATFEVMLLNATAAKRASQGLRAMEQLKLDQENDPAVLNILGPSSAPAGAEETGAVPLVSSCVLCGKKFISPEFLVRHQHKKHSDGSQHPKKQTKKKRTKEAPASEDSSGSGGSESDTPKKRRAPKTAPLPAEVIQALSDRNELTKQLMELQLQLQREKDKRAEEAKHAEQQQAQLATQLTNYMAKLQETLIDMEKKHEQSKHEMMRYTHEALERMKNEKAERTTTATKKSHAGRLESDEDAETVQKKKGTSPEEIEKRILDSLLRAQAEIHHKNSELEQANRKLQTKLRRKTRQLQLEPPPMTTLMSMAALDARRFGTDLGIDLEEKPRAKPKAVIVEDKPVQTDEEQQVQPKKTAEMPVRVPVNPPAKTEPKPVVRQPPQPLKRAESKLPTVSVAKAEPPKIVQPPTSKPEIKPPKLATPPKVEPTPAPAPTPVEVPKPPTPAPPKEPVVVVHDEKKPESKLQHAAHLVGKVALGFLTRRTLQNPSNWLVTLPRDALAYALSDQEQEDLARAHNGVLQDVTVEIEDDMTANDLRVVFAEALSGDADDARMVDYHRILLHHRASGQEISGDQFIYHLRNQLDVEIIPSFDAAEAHVDHVLSVQHDSLVSQIHDVRRASMEIAPDDLSLSLRLRARDDANDIATRSAIRLQALVRRFLAKRQLELLKIDRLVAARLAILRSPKRRAQSLSSARSQRQIMRSASVSAIHEELEDEKLVSDKAEQIHARLADLVQRKTGIDTRTKSAKWSRGQLSTAEYERHADAMQQNRAKLAPEVQQRISDISQRIDKLLEDAYDPVVAKKKEDQYVAASRIQLAMHVAVARKKLKQLLGRKDEKRDSRATIEHEKVSVPSREDDAVEDDADGIEQHDDKEVEDKEVEDKERDENDQDDTDELVDVEELDDADIGRLADAYEQAAGAKESPVSTRTPPKPEEKKDPPVAEAKPTVNTHPPRAGTPPPSRDDLLGRSPRPSDNTHVISPFSKTPLLSRRAGVTRRGSGYDNAR